MVYSDTFDIGESAFGVYAVAVRERLQTACMSDVEIENDIETLKNQLDHLKVKLKELLERKQKPVFPPTRS